ncbi:fas apoptotic inhibitory molecule 1 isoform X2 [Petaurus breviceps papuanus]|uniref:fas apoptotic inhibitory molecule 1 isoform X2 n=1 Tax=Petaurus breviceps papuanus TaxID=3040969 RepID=UPI0036D9F508
MTDLVAVWDVALSDGIHKIEFEHGTTSGKRVVYVDGKEEIRREWMFKLVGKETFSVGAAKTKATINIDAVSGFAYEYTLEIDGKSLKKYMENRSKTTNTWVLHLDGMDFRIVLVSCKYTNICLEQVFLGPHINIMKIQNGNISIRYYICKFLFLDHSYFFKAVTQGPGFIFNRLSMMTYLYIKGM